MNFLEKILFKDTLNNYRLQVLHHMKWFSLLLIAFLLVTLYLKTSHSKYGYAITKNIWPHQDKAKNLPDSVYYVANGIVPIKSNKLLTSFVLGAPEQRGNSFEFTNPELIAVIILLIFTHFFTKAIIKYGPFHNEAIKWLKKGVVLSLLVFFFKSVLYSFFDNQFEKDYGKQYSLDMSYYVGENGWLYFTLLLGFFLNIFQYGKKLQEENDLTV
jgi:Protein of unknown function (DUF2975)